MAIKQVPSKPTSGRFGIVCEYNGKPWALSFEWRDGMLYEYNSAEDLFNDYLNQRPDGSHWFDEYNPTFWISE